MAKTYRVGARTRLMNLPFKLMARLGVGARFRCILTVRGRSTGCAPGGARVPPPVLATTSSAP